MTSYMLRLGENIQPSPRGAPPRVPSVIIFVRHHGVAHIVYSHGSDLDYEVECVGYDGLRDAVQSVVCGDGVWFSRWKMVTSRSYEGEYDAELDVTELEPCSAEMWAAVVKDEFPCHVEECAALRDWHLEGERLIREWDEAEEVGRQAGAEFARREAALGERESYFASRVRR